MGGATEVHVRISSPPIRHPCYYGVDIGTYEELIAHHLPDVEQIRARIGADSLAYLSQEGECFFGWKWMGPRGAAAAAAAAATLA
jgi:glutamine phosphoribosylpyrophosphate amidotransferase